MPFSVGSVEFSRKRFVSKTNKQTKKQSQEQAKNKGTYVGNFLFPFTQFFGIRLCFSSCAMVLVNSNFEIPWCQLLHDFRHVIQLLFFRHFEPGYLHLLLVDGLVHSTQGLALLKNIDTTVEPRFNEGPRDWQNVFAVSRFFFSFILLLLG